MEGAEKADAEAEAAIVTMLYEIIVGYMIVQARQHGVEMDIARSLHERGHRKFHKKREASAKETLRETGT